MLEWGQKSPHAASFDIDLGAVAAPAATAACCCRSSGKPYGEALNAGEIELNYDADERQLLGLVFRPPLPINPQRYGEMLKVVVAAADAGDEPGGRALLALAEELCAAGLAVLSRSAGAETRLADIEGAAADHRARARSLSRRSRDRRDALHRLLERQHYRLAYWRLAVSGINYRRFFDINELAGLRVEDPAHVSRHPCAGRAADRGRSVAGIAARPHRRPARPGAIHQAAAAARSRRPRRRMRKPFYVMVEKILGDGEADAGVPGRRRHDRLRMAQHDLACAARPGRPRAARRSCGARSRRRAQDFAGMLERSKLRVLDTILASEFNVLVQLLSRIAAGHFSTRDYSSDRLRAALRLYVLEFPVYRTYVTAAGCVATTTARLIERTIAARTAALGRPRPRHFRFPARRVDARSDRRRPALQRVRGCASSR